jgi:hypothetical protein
MIINSKPNSKSQTNSKSKIKILNKYTNKFQIPSKFKFQTNSEKIIFKFKTNHRTSK